MLPNRPGIRREGRSNYLDDVTERQAAEWLDSLVDRHALDGWSASEGPFGPRYAIRTAAGVDHVTFGLIVAYLRGVEIGVNAGASPEHPARD